ncbi:MAG: ABC transporter ATP-binding protein [Planctomycetaceae bacterium]
MLLSLTDVTKTYRDGPREIRAVDRVSCALDAGEFVAVQGPSGCGKSTLLLMAGGLLTPDAGEVRVAGENPYAMPSEARARFRAERIGFVFQQFHLVPYLDVLGNVLAPAMAANVPEAESRARELIAHFGLADRIHHVPGKLSTGERQRTALARALLNHPKLLLADEPTGNLDRENAVAVLGYLRDFAEQGGGVLLVTHDPRAAEVADRTLEIRDGRLVAPQEVAIE